MELGNLSELPSKLFAPFITESITRLYQIDQKTGPNNIIDRGVNLAYSLSGRLNDHSLDRIARKFVSPYEYNSVKLFNPLMLIETTAPFDFYDAETGFRLKKGQRYLSIHLGENKEIPNTKERILDSMEMVKMYVTFHKGKLPGDSVVGITYSKLASAARRYGFTLTQTPLPEKEQKRLVKRLQYLQEERYSDITNIKLCFQPYSRLLPESTTENISSV